MIISQEYSSILDQQRSYFLSGATRSLSFRINQLKKLRKLITENEEKILIAVEKDLHKPEFENKLTETQFLLWEIDYFLKHTPEWILSKKAKTPLFHKPAKSRIMPEPLGNTLIVAPWNYPFQLIIAPLIAAIAAGNTAVIKPSELAPNSEKIITELIPIYFSNEYIAVVTGGIAEKSELLKLKWDLIFFTGSTEVGKIIMKAAAKNLTPVVLELGGKSPCIVDRHTNISQTARKIVWGKFLNAGQTCIAPDYILVEEPIKTELIHALKIAITSFYGENPELSDHYGRIINEQHFKRLIHYLHEAEIISGGGHNFKAKYIEPTLINNPKEDSAIMTDEIFGPVLPILSYKKIDEAINFINKRPKPLALYLFTTKNTLIRQVTQQTSSGGVCINDTISHITTPHLPFGGVGDSGMGQYHGEKGFEVFSHYKSILHKSQLIDYKFRYPPYIKLSKIILKIFKWLN